MDILLRTAGVALLGAVFCLVIKRGSPELGLLLGVAVVCILLVCALELFEGVAAFLKTLSQMASLPPEIFTPLLQTTAIAVITKLTAEACRDAGERAIATAAELVGSLLALTMAIPLFTRLLDVIRALH